jgi:hypothetical protein
MIYVVYSNNHAMDAKNVRVEASRLTTWRVLTATELPANVQVVQIRIQAVCLLQPIGS